MTSSLVFFCFQKNLPGTKLKGHEHLTLPLWHSSIFATSIPSRVLEMRERTYCCPRLVNRGISVVGDFLTCAGQIEASLIPQTPRSYRVLDTRRIIDLADRAKSQQGDGKVLSLPALDEWPFANVRRARARAVRIEERQDAKVWEQLQAFNVPPQHYHFVLRALWRKVPVAATMFGFRMTPTPECTLCTHPEDHAHILKRCLHLSLPCSIIRRSWGAAVHDNDWVEPSRLCLEHSTLS